MEIKRFSFGPFGTNTYVIHDGDNCTVVDCAAFDEAERSQLSAYLDREGLIPDLLVFTHGHLDHVWGAQWACRKWGLTAYIHEADFQQLEHLARQQESFGLVPRETEFPYRALTAAALKIHRSSFILISTPGHTEGSVCLYSESGKLLLSGDTLFDGGYGRTDLPGGNYMQLMSSLDRLSDTIPAGTTVYPGHGGEFRL